MSLSIRNLDHPWHRLDDNPNTNSYSSLLPYSAHTICTRVQGSISVPVRAVQKWAHFVEGTVKGVSKGLFRMFAEGCHDSFPVYTFVLAARITHEKPLQHVSIMLFRLDIVALFFFICLIHHGALYLTKLFLFNLRCFLLHELKFETSFLLNNLEEQLK